MKSAGSYCTGVVVPTQAVIDLTLNTGAVALTILALSTEGVENGLVDPDKDEVVV